MKFNEANMTATDRMAFEELKKRYGVEDGAEGAGAGAGAAPEGVGKAAGTGVVETPGAAAEGATGQQTAGEDIYKGLHPLVAAELIALRKQADAAQEEKLYNVAKKYEIIGKKPEELVSTLKALQAAGGTAYDDMIGVLDGAVAAVEKSGLFGEVGKRGVGATGGTDAWSQIEKKAEEIRKSNAALSYAESIDAACVQNPVGGLAYTISGGSHGGHEGGNGSHTHTAKPPQIKPGDRVLVAWVQNEAVVIDVVS